LYSDQWRKNSGEKTIFDSTGIGVLLLMVSFPNCLE
jgi:hypothetical protein